MKQINKIVIGTAQFGLDYGIANNLGKMKFQEIKKIINFARLKKIKNMILLMLTVIVKKDWERLELKILT